MCKSQRFYLALAFGLVPALAFLAHFSTTPGAAYALAGAPGNSGMRMYTSDVKIGAMQLVGDTAEGREVTRFDIAELKETHNVVIERDVSLSGVVPGATDWTIHLEGPVLYGGDSQIYSANACVDGVSLANLPLLDIALDPIINAAIADGHNPNVLIDLVNVVGEAGFVDITVDHMWTEAIILRLAKVDLRQLQLTVTPKTVAGPFQGSCIS